ncbi:MAG: hypothetical protein N2508_06905 [Anaerolineae bacterium]|nr:hypothetical protein [Anaerolineae bacterium]
MGTILKDMMLLFCIMVVASACTNSSSFDVPVLSSTATPKTGVILSPTATSTPIPCPTYTPTPVPTATPDPATMCQVPGEDGRIFVIDDGELQEHHLHYKAKEAFREAIRIHYPNWVSYTQRLIFGKMMVTHDLATIVWDAAPECIGRECIPPYSINPSVILSALILKYGELPPPDFDAYQAVRQIVLGMKHFYEKGSTQPEVWQDRFTNIGSYVMYEVMGQDEEALRRWCRAYHTTYYTFSLIWQTKRP